ncbi:MAG: hypothetical protein DKM50_13635 [Candidatus Margulisiibacteriota bacterium]|nr:MAG: hypothetical protein A2X43_05370 [Candidatus Margulisbacteria bacterium GWD2_39_127]OGI03427.1 MAG: hypothetical protein A2X42_05105 [Candidatus Margulisbacteria bacterium GWF2_38_17]OGI05616.1 MAG: hypothetical protein A2X41_06005 [Candidatus Margulisbacteria bacterium GWE2_39_32]PZM77247.1 MAG: hypothetical protein DKM50_13635 [Candidatus Margulisiibacteriota bacterium]HAR64471.1 hypothetical protein [Candidatus Margulisiibacteriota bacterium]
MKWQMYSSLSEIGRGVVRIIIETIVVAIVYYLAAKLGGILVVYPGNVAPIWVPSGIALAFVLLFGYRVLYGIWLGASLANIAQLSAYPTFSGYAFLAGTMIGGGAALQAFAGGYIIRRFTGTSYPMAKLYHVFIFVVAVFVSVLISPFIGTTLLLIGGFIEPSEYPFAWVTWWVGHLVRALIITPLILAWSRPLSLKLRKWPMITALIFISALVITELVVFSDILFSNKPHYPIQYLLLPFIFWVAYAYGMKGMSFLSLAVSIPAIVSTAFGFGPFARDNVIVALLILQGYLGIYTIVGLALTAAIQELRQSEKDLQIRTTDLEIANDDLESFSYSVSHDLRRPLRAINGYSHILRYEYQTMSDDEREDYLNKLENSSLGMAVLIDDILNLSRVSRLELKRASINLSKIVEDTLTELHESQPERKVEVVIKKNVIAEADANMLQIALGNMLDNAWKYTAKRDVARIEFRTEVINNTRTYVISDNGVGFGMADAAGIFEPFKRVGNVREFQGTGIGLAIVKRVIVKHNGRIWAESEYDKGATFYFTLG